MAIMIGSSTIRSSVVWPHYRVTLRLIVLLRARNGKCMFGLDSRNFTMIFRVSVDELEGDQVCTVSMLIC